MLPENSTELMPPTTADAPQRTAPTTDDFGAGIDVDSAKASFRQEQSSAGTGPAETDSTAHSEEEFLGSLPPEIAMLLVLAGIAGMVLPGPVGTPLLIAGGVTLWPRTFRPIEKWFNHRFPAAHREGVAQIHRFIEDLNRRFPEPK